VHPCISASIYPCIRASVHPCIYTSDQRSESLSLNLDQICVSIYLSKQVCPFKVMSPYLISPSRHFEILLTYTNILKNSEKRFYSNSNVRNFLLNYQFEFEFQDNFSNSNNFIPKFKNLPPVSF